MPRLARLHMVATMSNQPGNLARDVAKITRIAPIGRWAGRAACAGTDPDLWFLETEGSYREARAICAGCPVRAECLEWALETKTEHGLFGGLTARQRKQLSQASRAVAQ